MEYFYYFGIVYIIYQVRSAWVDYHDQEDAKKSFKDALPDKMDSDALKKSLSKSVDDFKKQLPDFIMQLACLGWVVMGITYAPESSLFILLLFVILSLYILAGVYSFRYISKNKNKIIDQFKQGEMKKISEDTVNDIPDTRGILLCDKILRILVVLYIFYVHYFSVI